MAQVSVDDLEPEQLEDQARDLAELAHWKRTGEAVDRRDIGLQYSPPLSGEDYMGCCIASP